MSSLRRVRAPYFKTLLKPRKDLNGAVCLTCLKLVDNEEMVEGYARNRDTGAVGGQYPYAKVLYRCHGAEELVTFEFDTVEWDDRDLMRQVQRVRLFDPMGHKDEGSLTVQVRAKSAH